MSISPNAKSTNLMRMGNATNALINPIKGGGGHLCLPDFPRK